MKKLTAFYLPLIVCFFWISLVSGGNDSALEAQMNTLKQECKELITGTRYEGSKITYYHVGASKQTKNIEVFMFLSNEYQFAVSAKKCSVPVSIKIYDAPTEVKGRTLIEEFKKVQGKNWKFSSNDLNEKYLKKKPGSDRLKNIHIEYSIASGKESKEGIVLVYGNKS
ncbi:hypothetical protein [Fluviicola sp.]|uniref:hypothetical protein n=1 Tax=Fluviicola sp. TaxID=1917219 RepID=UPI00261834CB|nr:hypothetical protein [Fluviicola sp.]